MQRANLSRAAGEITHTPVENLHRPKRVGEQDSRVETFLLQSAGSHSRKLVRVAVDLLGAYSTRSGRSSYTQGIQAEWSGRSGSIVRTLRQHENNPPLRPVGSSCYLA